MPAIGFWQVVKILFVCLPDIISLIKRSIVWVDGVIDYAKTKQAMKTMVEGINHAIETGDTSLVEDIFRGGPARP